MSPVDARVAARRAFGAVQPMKEAYLDQTGGRWLIDLRDDLAYGVRALARAPAFAAVAVLTLALGIGANTPIFSIINGLFLRVLPVAEPEQLIEVRGVPGGLAGFDVLAATADVFTGVASHEMTQFNLGSGADAEWVDGLWASARFLDTVGVRLVPVVASSLPTTTVGRQQRQIGIRLALGSQRASVVGIVLSRAALLILAGVAGGTVVSL